MNNVREQIFADRLKSVRIERGYTQEQLADKAGVSRVSIGFYEHGRVPPVDLVIKLADILDVTVGWLCGKSEIQQESKITMDKVREKILRAAIERYGRGTQRDKAIEELSELIRALARCDDPENIAEEMADVRIMLDQLELIFHNGPAVAKWEIMKLQRLDQRVHAADVVG